MRKKINENEVYFKWEKIIRVIGNSHKEKGYKTQEITNFFLPPPTLNGFINPPLFYVNSSLCQTSGEDLPNEIQIDLYEVIEEKTVSIKSDSGIQSSFIFPATCNTPTVCSYRNLIRASCFRLKWDEGLFNGKHFTFELN